jgi:hypothetical protein
MYKRGVAIFPHLTSRFGNVGTSIISEAVKAFHLSFRREVFLLAAAFNFDTLGAIACWSAPSTFRIDLN